MPIETKPGSSTTPISSPSSELPWQDLLNRTHRTPPDDYFTHPGNFGYSSCKLISISIPLLFSTSLFVFNIY